MLLCFKGAVVHSSMSSGHALRKLGSDPVARPLRYTRRRLSADGPLLYLPKNSLHMCRLHSELHLRDRAKRPRNLRMDFAMSS